MIVSASYKTDIPTFYGAWFLNRLRAGYCRVVNPWNRQQTFRVSLTPGDVDGFVFWTKNLAPFIEHLKIVHALGYPFVVQYTINGYPRELESSVVDADRNVATLRTMAETYGARACVWRYDTIVFSSRTPLEAHRRRFATLCRQLEGATDEVVVSFVQGYRKTVRNLNRAAAEFGFTWDDPSIEVKRRLVVELAAMAHASGMQLTICAQPELLVPEARAARCIDAERLADVAGRPVLAALRGTRPECACHASRDIGDYDTCPHGCVYCYAVRDRSLALRRHQQHDPHGEFLFPFDVPNPQTQPFPRRSLPLVDSSSAAQPAAADAPSKCEASAEVATSHRDISRRRRSGWGE
jgi:hypothetical protein